MKKRKLLLIILFVVCQNYTSVYTQVANRNQNQFDVRTQIDSIMDKYKTEGFSGSVLVVKNGKTLIHKNYGFANESIRNRNTVQTRFNVASISKIFTAAAILKLESQGKLKTTDLLNKYFGEMTGEKNTATIHHLLCHTGGLVKRGSDLDYSSRDSLIDSVKRSPMESIPGKEHRYSNLGYSLLAAIVEITSGLSYEEYLFENVIRPAGELGIGHAWEQKMGSLPLAIGYNKNDVAEPRDVDSWGDKGASSLIMTPNDLKKWIRKLQRGKILNKSQLAKMLFNHSQGNESYAFHKGFLKDGARVFWKGGGHPGFESQFLWYPEKETMVIFFINKNKGLRKRIFPDLRKLIENSFD